MSASAIVKHRRHGASNGRNRQIADRRLFEVAKHDGAVVASCCMRNSRKAPRWRELIGHSLTLRRVRKGLLIRLTFRKVSVDLSVDQTIDQMQSCMLGENIDRFDFVHWRAN